MALPCSDGLLDDSEEGSEEDMKLEVGAHVRIVGLKSAAHLNYKVGVVSNSLHL